MSTEILEWEDENILTDFPINVGELGKSVIIDARFIQFDGFVPFLSTLTVTPDEIIFIIKFDTFTKTCSFSRFDFSPFTPFAYLNSDDINDVRFLGTITFGDGFFPLFRSSVGKVFNINAFFDPATVIPVNKNNAVYTLDSLFGSINFRNTDTQDTFFSAATNFITCNAVKNHTIPNDPIIALKQLNLKRPTHNNLFIAGNDVLKIKPVSSGINLSIVSTANRTQTIPTLIS